MRIVIAHNHYRSGTPSGENRMVRQMTELLTSAGVEVVPFFRFSDEIDSAPWWRKAALPLSPIHSFEAQREFRELLRQFRPDVIQLHNPYPLISPSIIRAAHGARVPVLNFVHNYRHVCLAGSLRRDAHECHECLHAGSSLPAIRHACYRGSRPQTAVMALSGLAHSGTWRLVDRFIAVSGFVRDRLVDGGIDAARVVVQHNTVPDPGPQREATGGTFLFAGRLDEDKGIGLLLEAWRVAGLGESATLEIAGSGPLAEDVAEAARSDPGIRQLGQLDPSGMRSAYGRASAVVVPSVVDEACPLTALEALAQGRAVIGTRVGGLPEVVTPEAGWLSAPRVDDLARALRSAFRDPDGVAARGRAARARYEERFHPRRVVGELIRLHEESVERSGTSTRK